MLGQKMLDIEVLFPVDLGHNSIQDQTVPASGLRPEIRIQRIEESSIHTFGIEKRIPHHHTNVLVAVVTEAEHQLGPFITVLSHLMRQPLRLTGEIRYLHEGKVRVVTRAPSIDKGATLGQGFAPTWFTEKAAQLSIRYDLELLKRLNFSRFLDDPISRYLSLYQLLLSEHEDKQENVDRALLSLDPTIELSIPAGRQNSETTFTRLRNEISHHRPTASISETHREIHSQVVRFGWLVDEILSTRLTTSA